MSKQELNNLLTVISQKLAGEASNHRYVQARFSGYDHFCAQGEFLKQIVQAVSGNALDRIDELAGNPHWFLVMLATTLVLSDTLPASPEDVSRALTLQRQLALQSAGQSVIARCSGRQI